MNNIPCYLIPALVGLICAILGYLLGKLLSNSGDNPSLLTLQSELDACRLNSRSLSAKISALENELAAAKLKTTQSFVATAPAMLFDSALYTSIFEKKIEQDDLKIIEGIGPKIEELYHEAGIRSWQALSETSLQKLQSILDGGGEKYAVHNPATWARQAELAYQGKWQQLKDLQKELKGGKE